MTRGLRNNNPLNIRRVVGKHWKGEVLPQRGSGGWLLSNSLPSNTASEPPAASSTPTVKSTKPYASKKDIIRRWAPETENDTEAYIRAVCAITGFGGKERLTESEWSALVKAMVIIESEMLLSNETLHATYNLYLNLKPKQQ